MVGYATPIAERYSLDMFFVSRGMHNFIEDVPSRQNGTAPDSGPYVASNLPCAAFAACQSADARRTYKAFTIDLTRRLSGKWMGDVSYTWSRFEGNFDLDYSPATSPSPCSTHRRSSRTDPARTSRIRIDSGRCSRIGPHVFKVFGSYAVTDRLAVSSYLRVQSGTPWAARGRDWEGAVLNFLEPSGSHRNPTWTNLDLMGTYRLARAGRA